MSKQNTILSITFKKYLLWICIWKLMWVVPVLLPLDNPKAGSYVVEETRICRSCKEEKILSEEYHRSHGTFAKHCKKCISAKSKANRIKMQGYIYVVGNPAWDGYFKIGRTINMQRRLDSYQTGSPHRDYKLHYLSAILNDLLAAEKRIYNKFLFVGEWCSADLVDIIALIKEIESGNMIF